MLKNMQFRVVFIIFICGVGKFTLFLQNVVDYRQIAPPTRRSRALEWQNESKRPIS